MARGPRVTISALPWNLMQNMMDEVIHVPMFRVGPQVEGHSPTTQSTAAHSSPTLAE